jgi:hypothetical protein
MTLTLEIIESIVLSSLWSERKMRLWSCLWSSTSTSCSEITCKCVLDTCWIAYREREEHVLDTYRICHTVKPMSGEIWSMIYSFKKLRNPGNVVFLTGTSLQSLKITISWSPDLVKIEIINKINARQKKSMFRNYTLRGPCKERKAVCKVSKTFLKMLKATDQIAQNVEQ